MSENKQKKPLKRNNTQAFIDDHNKVIRRIVWGAMGVLAVLSGFVIYETHQSNIQTAVQAKKNKQKYQNLQQELKAAKNAIVIDPTDGQAIMSNAIKNGNKLADIQNEYVNDGDNTKKIAQTRTKMQQMLASSDDDTAIWYNTGQSKIKSKWYFDSKYNFAQSKITTVFTNETKDGDILAYTLADYLPQKGQFTNLKTVITQDGNAAIKSQDAAKNNQYKKRELDKTIDTIKKSNKEFDKKHKIKPSTQKQRNELEKHRQAEIKKYFEKHPDQKPAGYK